MAESAFRGTPRFGIVIPRRRLLSVARTQNPDLIVVCAPAGYGKSVFAAQLADSGNFDSVCWVSLYDSDVRGEEWVTRVVAALAPVDVVEESRIGSEMPVVRVTRADGWLRLNEILQRHASTSICIVLDGCARIDGIQALEELGSVLRTMTCASSRLLVTCRFVSDPPDAPDPSRVWVVDQDDLRFSPGDVSELLKLTGEGGEALQEAERTRERFDGHPALTCLMMRHRDVDDRVTPPRDLRWYAQRMVLQLPGHAVGMLYCASLLHEGCAEELDTCVTASSDALDWDAAQLAAPLVHVIRDDGGLPVRFRVHAVLCGAFIDTAPSILGPQVAARLRAEVLNVLQFGRDYVRIQAVLVSACTEQEVAQWLEMHGAQLLRFAGPAALERCVGRIPATQVASSAKLLLLRAAALREQERVDEAMTHASLSLCLAEANGDRDTQTCATLLSCRLAIDADELQRARSILDRLWCSAGESSMSTPSACLYEGYHSLLDAYALDNVGASEHAGRAMKLIGELDVGSQEAVLAANCVAAVEGVFHGRWDRVETLFARTLSCPTLPPLQRVLCVANSAVAHLEMGSLSRALSAIDGLLPEIRSAGLQALEGYVLGTRSDIVLTLSDNDPEECFNRSQALLSESGTLLARVGELALKSMACRSHARAEEALALAEAALALVRSEGESSASVRVTAEIEVAASLLKLGDSSGARRLATGIRGRIADSGVAQQLLLLDLILAEIARSCGETEHAATLLRGHWDYISTGSANWRTAMYVRAFPGLLEVLVAAAEEEVLPLRMLSLLSLSDTEHKAAMSGPPDKTGPNPCERHERGGPVASSCRVRLFGGLDVTTRAGHVNEGHWRKRKARQLFAMLVVRQGQDLPRDVILERLWPDMDEERARRNFYVTWSTMKRALACGSSPAESNELVEYTGNACRITRSVESDLAEFDRAMATLRRANHAQDLEGIVSAAHQIADIYQGELLPGDLYEEWLSDVRDRTKHDFCEAMVAGARVAETQSNLDASLTFLRRGSAADPWREDVYQAMMRCQIGAGQRSHAIETYLTCRSKLVEDLGIDPSSETTRLYQTVLAMEDSGSTEVGRRCTVV